MPVFITGVIVYLIVFTLAEAAGFLEGKRGEATVAAKLRCGYDGYDVMDLRFLRSVTSVAAMCFVCFSY